MVKVSKDTCQKIAGIALLLYSLFNLCQVMSGVPFAVIFSFAYTLLGYIIGPLLYTGSIICLFIMLLKKSGKNIIPLSILLFVKICALFDRGLEDMALFYVANIFSFVATILLVLLALNNENIKPRISKLWFVPAILEVLYLLIMTFNYGFLIFQPYTFLIKQLIYCVAIVFLGLSFVTTYQSGKATGGIEGSFTTERELSTDYGYCDMTKHILLLVFVSWVWLYVWIYRTTKYLNSIPTEEKRDPLKKLLLCMFVPFYYTYWLYQSARRIELLSKSKNVDVDKDFVLLSTVLSFVIGIIPSIILQNKLNQICKNENNMSRVSEVNTFSKTVEKNEFNSDKTDEIRNYKKLLDDGIITEEEFAAKKKQLMGL